jgi:thiamine biosynthesis lipoprotein
MDLMTLSNKSKTKLPHSWAFDAFGTQWAIEARDVLTPRLKAIVSHRLDEFDGIYSRFRSDSLVSRLSTPGTYEFPDDFRNIFEIYRTSFQLTDGRMTPLVGSMLEDAGYDKTYSLEPKEIQPIPDLLEVIQWDGKNTITSSKPVVFDVGAAGKGYAVDIIAELLEENGIQDYIIDASGDIKHHSSSSEQIGLEHPGDPSKVIGIANLNHQSLCASASNRRAWKGFHHIMDPSTRQSVNHIVASWVIADNTLVADAMATALFFVESPDELMKHFSFSYVRMFASGRVDYSTNFEGELFT